MTGLIQTLLAEPAAPDPPRRVWRDWVVVGIAIPMVIVEGIVNASATWRPLSTIGVAALVTLLLWRRTHPLAVTAVGFGALIVASQISYAVSGEPFEYYSSAVMLLSLYALFRWGSGRQAAIGLGIMLIAFASSLITDWTGFGDAIGGAFIMFATMALGVEVRQLVGRRGRDLEQAKARERELLARELHDTVAHHVSAIVIRAQAGRVVGRNDADAALDALDVIEQEASRTLAEMRGIVGSLRGDDRAEFAPQASLDDLHRLADEAPIPGSDRHLRVHVTVDDDVGELGPTVGAALYRLAQEAVTNARRHARHATEVSIGVVGDGACVQLTVDDDGTPAHGASGVAAGFGLVGMTERAHLLGGTLSAGPRSGRGWRVQATIPRQAVGS